MICIVSVTFTFKMNMNCQIFEIQFQISYFIVTVEGKYTVLCVVYLVMFFYKLLSINKSYKRIFMGYRHIFSTL